MYKMANNEKVYQVVSERHGVMYFTLGQLETQFKVTGYNHNNHGREELQGEPKLHGLLGPMWNGYNDQGQQVIRYETSYVYNQLSQ